MIDIIKKKHYPHNYYIFFIIFNIIINMNLSILSLYHQYHHLIAYNHYNQSFWMFLISLHLGPTRRRDPHKVLPSDGRWLVDNKCAAAVDATRTLAPELRLCDSS